MATTKSVPAFVQFLKSSKDSLQIINGPGKFDLMESLFSRGKIVLFEVKLPNGSVEKVEFYMIAIGKEDGSAESWLLRMKPIHADSKGPPIKAYYSSISRKGTISIADDHRHLY